MRLHLEVAAKMMQDYDGYFAATTITAVTTTWIKLPELTSFEPLLLYLFVALHLIYK